jgi:hypothetical protein
MRLVPTRSRLLAIPAAMLAVMSGCVEVDFIDAKKTPIRSDLADAQGRIGAACENRDDTSGSGQPARFFREGNPLFQRYRRKPDAKYRPYGDEADTTARAEIEELLSWIAPRCPEIARLIREATAR